MHFDAVYPERNRETQCKLPSEDCNLIDYKQKGFTSIVILIGLVIVVVIGGGAYFLGKLPIKPADNSKRACTQEAKICPDGSSVGRSGPNCEFALCPVLKPTSSPNEITNWKIYTNSKYGFEIKYPDGFKVHEYDAISQDSESEFWLILNKNAVLPKNTELSLNYPWKDLSSIDKGLYVVVTPKGWPQINLNKPNYTCQECVTRFKNQQTAFANMKAMKSIAEFPDDPSVNEGMQPYTYLIFNYQGKGWSIAYDHSDFKGNYDPIYDQIFATFKFTQ